MPKLALTTIAGFTGLSGLLKGVPMPIYKAKQGAELNGRATSPPPKNDDADHPSSSDSRDSRASRVPERCAKMFAGLLGEIHGCLNSYLIMTEETALVTSTWVMASWLSDLYDRFPHLAISSPEKRCGKTLLLEILKLIVNKPRLTTNISPAALYREIENQKPTLLLDEAQSLSRRGSEMSEVIREILNAGIEHDAAVIRCEGRDHKTKSFSVYGPKVFAAIGGPDSVLADRCLVVPMRRKMPAEKVKRYRYRQVKAYGEELHQKIREWAQKNQEKVQQVYDGIEPFNIENDRLADLLTPLQAVLQVLEEDEGLRILKQYAENAKDDEEESTAIRLLSALREIFTTSSNLLHEGRLFPTVCLLTKLVDQEESLWKTYNHGEPIADEGLARLLRPFKIRSGRIGNKGPRGYFLFDLQEVWKRYLPERKEDHGH